MIQKSEIFLNEKCIKIKAEDAFKGFASTYNVGILNSFNPELHFKDTESAIKSKLIELLTQLKRFYWQFLFKLKSRSIYQWKWLWWCVSIKLYYKYNKHTKIFRKRSRLDYWFSHYHTISISKYNHFAGSSYIKLPKGLDHPRKGLIDIKILMIMNVLNGVLSDN